MHVCIYGNILSCPCTCLAVMCMYMYVAPAACMVGRVPLIPLSLAGNSTPTIPHRQTISFIEISIEAGILLGGKHEARFVLGGGRNWTHAVLTKLDGTINIFLLHLRFLTSHSSLTERVQSSSFKRPARGLSRLNGCVIHWSRDNVVLQCQQVSFGARLENMPRKQIWHSGRQIFLSGPGRDRRSFKFPNKNAKIFLQKLWRKIRRKWSKI